MISWVIDTETLANCFVLYALHYKDDSVSRTFVIHDLRNDFEEMANFLENCAENGEYHIGFNNLSFDAQILDSIIRNREPLSKLNPSQIASKIYKKAQNIIAEQDYSDRSSGVQEKRLAIRQIDLYKMNHWDNPARKSSLKWLQYTCDWKNIQEMPIHHSTLINSQEQIDIVVNYCKNDVEFTKYLYVKSLPALQVRKDIKAKYKLSCYNYSNTKIGSELLLKKYCEKTGKKKFDVKQVQTKRSIIKVKDILFSYISFNTPEFKNLYELFINSELEVAKGAFKHLVKYKSSTFTYGVGGCHQCTSPGQYHTDDFFLIIDADIQSMYPSIACVNGMYPAHLGPEFYQTYKEDIVDIRLQEKAKGKSGNKAIVDGFKEAANASFGNSNQINSWLYDPQYLIQTTINGQLMISMLVESLSILPESEILQTNTDGVTIKIKANDLDRYYEICKSWEETTKLKLEYAMMKSMFLWDVNNYIALYSDSTKPAKCKGRFQFNELELHKNKSNLVIPKAIFAFFNEGIAPEDYLKSNRNIYDYCSGVRTKSDWGFVETEVKNGILKERHLQKVIRYYISMSGSKILKVNKSDGRKINTQAGHWLQREFNTYEEKDWKEYTIDESFYLMNIHKEIKPLVVNKTKQLELF